MNDPTQDEQDPAFKLRPLPFSTPALFIDGFVTGALPDLSFNPPEFRTARVVYANLFKYFAFVGGLSRDRADTLYANAQLRYGVGEVSVNLAVIVCQLAPVLAARVFAVINRLYDNLLNVFGPLLLYSYILDHLLLDLCFAALYHSSSLSLSLFPESYER